jgi:non-canonical (house-cleaning) NTP pyrophosphatase
MRMLSPGEFEVSVPAMPITDWQLMQGARERALAAEESLKSRRLEADIYVGLEGGFHSNLNRRRMAHISSWLGLCH